MQPKRYSTQHEWVTLEDPIATIGISDHAQQMLGDIVYIELPQVDTAITAGNVVGVIESVKAASDIYTPLSGTVTAINTALEAQPELLNQEAESAAWLDRMRITDHDQYTALMDIENYQKYCSADNQ